MSALPELTDEQIDAVYGDAYVTPLDRENVGWRRLRKAFPAPKPPAPKWESGALVVTVATAHEHLIPRDLVGVWVEHGTYGLMPPATARDMAAALIEAADWIEANR